MSLVTGILRAILVYDMEEIYFAILDFVLATVHCGLQVSQKFYIEDSEIYMNKALNFGKDLMEEIEKKISTLCIGIGWFVWQMNEHMNYEGMVICWMVSICGMLLMSHLGYVKMGSRPTCRLERKKLRVSRHGERLQLRVLLMFSLVGHAQCMDVAQMQQMMQSMAALTEAATKAATSAEKALTTMQGGGSASSSSGDGMIAASKILKNPDTFNGDDPTMFQQWKFTFSSWLVYGDQRFQEILENVEKSTGD